jgi:GTP cyclohydrolase II
MMITEIARHELETEYGKFLLAGFLFGDKQQTVFALWRPDPSGERTATLLRVQYGCINGSVFRAIDCDCGAQIDSALRMIAEAGCGIFVYFSDHEAFGLGIVKKMQIVALEKETRTSFTEIARAQNFELRSADVLWIMPHLFAAVGLDKTVVLLGRNFEKRRRLEELGFKVIRQEEIAIDESKLSEDALRERKEKGSLFVKMTPSLRRLRKFGVSKAANGIE